MTTKPSKEQLIRIINKSELKTLRKKTCDDCGKRPVIVRVVCAEQGCRNLFHLTCPGLKYKNDSDICEKCLDLRMAIFPWWDDTKDW